MPLERSLLAFPELASAHRHVVELAHAVIDVRDDLPDEWKQFVSGLSQPGLLADLIASTLPLALDERVALLAELDPARRLERMAAHLERELTIARAQKALRAEKSSEEIDPRRVFGLTIGAQRLLEIRRARLRHLGVSGDNGYAELEQIRKELQWAREVFHGHPDWTILDVTRRAIEETASEIFAQYSARFGLPTV